MGEGMSEDKRRVTDAEIEAGTKAECTGCGCRKTIAQIRSENPRARSCCPERDMREGMSDGHELPDGVEVVVNLYVTSEGEGIDVVLAGTFRGGVKRLDGLPADWRVAAERFGMDTSPLDRLADDWRYMTRDEVMTYKKDNPQ